MEAVQSPVTENIIGLTLEVIALLTGEDYGVVRKHSDSAVTDGSIPAPKAASRGPSPATQLMHGPLSRDVENDKKILEATNKIIHLLTGEVWRFLGYAASSDDSVVQENPTTSHPGTSAYSQTKATPSEIKREFISGPEESRQHDDHLLSMKNKNEVAGNNNACSEGRAFSGNEEDLTQPQYEIMEGTPGEHVLHLDQLVNPSDHFSQQDQVVNHTEEMTPPLTVCPQYSSRIKEELCSEKCITPTEIGLQKDTRLSNQAEPVTYEEPESTNLYVQMDYTVPDSDEDSDSATRLKRKEITSRTASNYDERLYNHPFSAEITFTVDKAHECLECHKTFTRNSDLLKHQKVHQPGQSMTCPQCGKCFTKNSMYVRHQRSHTGEKPFTCPDCGKSFAVGAHLTTHQRIHTGEKPFVCADCGKSFSQKASLIKHRRTHTGEKPFVCSDCGKCFTSSTNLTLHYRVHTGEKPYSCSVCGKCFRSSPNLISHQRIHTGEKPYSCKVCGKFFTNSSVLVRHHRTHTGEKPFLCSECGKRFTRNSQLVKHQLIHLGQRPYACTQ